MTGFPSSSPDYNKAKQVLYLFPCYPINRAIAEEHKLTFATRDTNAFHPGRHPSVIVPYTLPPPSSAT